MGEQMIRHNGNGRAADLQKVPPSERMLLLPHCLRPVQGCPGKMTQSGLDCAGCTRSDCKIMPMQAAALQSGFKGICVAPGGRLAVRCVAAVRPAAIVAVACDKELEAGVAAVNALEWEGPPPFVVRSPLLRDGCVDTDVEVSEVIALIEA